MKKKLLFATALMLCAGSMMAQPAQWSKPKVLIKSSQSLMAPVWSPDGSKIAVTGDNYIGIWVANADGSSIQQVSNEPGAGYKMTWSDAHNIISTPYTMQNNRRMTHIENIDVNTGVSRVVAPSERNFKRSKATGAVNVLQVMLDQPSQATQLIKSLNKYAGKMILNPALSPDGTKIAFQIVSNGVWVCNADGTNPVSLGKGAYPAWMPDSRNLVVTRLTDNGDRFTSSELYCIDSQSGNAVCITSESNVIPVTTAVSPDGKTIAFDNDADGYIYTINLK